jgi:hypothetical protein
MTFEQKEKKMEKISFFSLFSSIYKFFAIVNKIHCNFSLYYPFFNELNILGQFGPIFGHP